MYSCRSLFIFSITGAGACLVVVGVVGERHFHLDRLAQVVDHQRVGARVRVRDLLLVGPVHPDPLVGVGIARIAIVGLGQPVVVYRPLRGGQRLAHPRRARNGRVARRGVVAGALRAFQGDVVAHRPGETRIEPGPDSGSHRVGGGDFEGRAADMAGERIGGVRKIARELEFEPTRATDKDAIERVAGAVIRKVVVGPDGGVGARRGRNAVRAPNDAAIDLLNLARTGPELGLGKRGWGEA